MCGLCRKVQVVKSGSAEGSEWIGRRELGSAEGSGTEQESIACKRVSAGAAKEGEKERTERNLIKQTARRLPPSLYVFFFRSVGRELTDRQSNRQQTDKETDIINNELGIAGWNPR